MSYMSDAINKLYLKTEELKNDLLELSRVIHSNPEIKWKEYKAVENIKSLLIENGLEFNSVENYPTAFVSSIKGKRFLFGVGQEAVVILTVGTSTGISGTTGASKTSCSGRV